MVPGPSGPRRSAIATPLIRYTKACSEAAKIDWVRELGRGGRPITIRVFENGFLERVLGQAHPITPILWFGAPIAYGVWAGLVGPGVAITLGLFALGLLLWTLLEYVLHRVLFHFEAKSDASRFRLFMMHGYHHLYPDDPMRLVAPPLMSWPLAILIGGLYRGALGPELFWPLLSGTMLGYLAYDWIHYYTHHFRPTGIVGKFLRRHHMVHHFKTPDANFGISTPLWDFVFGTYRPHEPNASTASAEV